MAPALLAGDRLVVVGRPGCRSPGPKPGAVVAVRDPRLRTAFSSRGCRASTGGRDTWRWSAIPPGEHRQPDLRPGAPVVVVVGRAVYRYGPAGRSGPAPWPEEYHRA